MSYLDKMFSVEAVVIALALGAFVALVAGFVALAHSSAKSQGGYFFTHVQEGTTKIIMKGDSFHRIIWSLDGYFINVPDSPYFVEGERPWEVLSKEHHPEAYARYLRQRSWLERKLGIFWVGLPPFFKVYTYTFEWIEETKDEDGTSKPKHREATTDFIYLKSFPYYLRLTEAETKDNLPLNAWYLLTTRTTNPYTSLFETEDWLQQVTASANREARNYIGTKGFQQLVSETDEDCDDDLFSRPILKLNTKLRDGEADESLEKRFGQHIVSAELVELELPEGISDHLRDATTAKYVAEKNADARRAEAEGEADAIKSEARGEANRIREIARANDYRIKRIYESIQGFGELGKLIRQLEAMETPGEGRTVIWANNPLLEKSPDLANLLDSLGVTPSEFKKIAKEVRSE